MSLSKVYQYWFDNDIHNLQRHWIPISKPDIAKKSRDIEINFMSIYLDCLYKAIYLENCKNVNYKTIPLKDKISIIIILDQFTRSLGKKYKYVLRIKKVCSIMCLKIINDIIMGDFLKLNPNELLFVLMVYKHIDYKYFTFVSDIISIYCKYNNVKLKDKNMCNLMRFYVDFYEKYVFNNFPNANSLDISEKCEYLIDNDTLYKDICIRDGFLPIDFSSIVYSEDISRINLIEKDLYSVMTSIRDRRICISLSGGVDSMVLAYILKKLESRLECRVCAFHLTYNNREECLLEKKLIWNYCHKLEIPLYNYNIEYIKRGDIKRESYEKITREIRFRCYREMGCPIVLGHIKEDVVENIFTNMSTNKHMFDLQKIHEHSIIDGVTILRPFVNTEKKRILDYAHSKNIPYLNNTTPYWSNRGRFRKDFVPAYIKQFGNEGISNIDKFASTLRDYGEIITESIIEPNVNLLINNKKITIGPALRKNEHLVREIFKRYSHSLGYSMPSEKSITGLIACLRNGKNKKYMLSKNIRLEIEDDNVQCYV